MKELLKRRLPHQTVALADRGRWTFRRRQEYGPELRYTTALRLAQLAPSDVVLEVGHCSYQTISMARRVQSVLVCNISGVNRAVAVRGPKNLRQVIGDVCTYSFEPNSVDVEFVIAVLEHIPNDAAAMHNLHSVLKPNGRLVVYVPDTNEHLAAWQRGEYPDHVRPGYTRENLRSILESTGFQVTHCELEHGVYSAVAGDLYYGLGARIPFLYQLPHFLERILIGFVGTQGQCLVLARRMGDHKGSPLPQTEQEFALIRAFMGLVARDEHKAGSLRWGLFAKAVKTI